MINPGSVGQPRDGDPRAAYVVIEDGVVHFRRQEYDIEEVIRRLKNTGMSRAPLDFAAEMLRTGGQARDQGTSIP